MNDIAYVPEFTLSDDDEDEFDAIFHPEPRNAPRAQAPAPAVAAKAPAPTAPPAAASDVLSWNQITKQQWAEIARRYDASDRTKEVVCQLAAYKASKLVAKQQGWGPEFAAQLIGVGYEAALAKWDGAVQAYDSTKDNG